MDIADLKKRYDHPAWFTAAGTFVAYGLILGVMTVLLFAIPYAVFLLF